jgi:hypothetical protein
MIGPPVTRARICASSKQHSSERQRVDSELFIDVAGVPVVPQVVMYAHARTAASVERTIACYFYLFRNICVVLCEPAKGLTCPQAKTTN